MSRIRRLKPSRRHLRTGLMATAPAAALFGFTGMQAPRAPATALASYSASDSRVPVSQTPERDVRPLDAPPAAVEASYYGDEFAGRPTASGETFNPRLLTAAHRTLPFGSLVRVTNAATGNQVIVRVNDRGPFHGNREIDLSEAAAHKIGIKSAGTGMVRLDAVRRA